MGPLPNLKPLKVREGGGRAWARRLLSDEKHRFDSIPVIRSVSTPWVDRGVAMLPGGADGKEETA
jgi:hypothetical protein